MDWVSLQTGVLDVLMWGFVWLVIAACIVAILLGVLVRAEWLDTVWHWLGRYLRWRKGK